MASEPREDNDVVYLELTTPLSALLPACPRLTLGERVMRLGRDPGGDLVLTEDSVSWRHASIWLSRGEIFVVDHGSTNGTWLDDQRVDRETVARSGQILRLGRLVTLRLGRRGVAGRRTDPLWRLEIAETGASFAVPPEGIRIGGGPDVEVSLPLVGGGVIRARPRAEGVEIEGSSGAMMFVRADQAVEVAGLHLCVRPGQGEPVRTAGQARQSDRYRLRVTLSGRSGPEAVIEDPERGLRHRVRAENRAVLLFLLASKLLADRSARVPPDRAGWCTDEDLAMGVWGRGASRMDANNLHVLTHRLRRELEDAGFEAEFLEKERNAMRTILTHITRE